MVQEKKKRRRLILFQTSQPRILITMLILLGLVAVIMMVFVYLEYNIKLSERFPGFSSIQPVIISTLVVVNLFAVVFSLVLILLFSHRIAGPIYNLGLIMRGVAQGDISGEIKFRNKDFLQEIADDGNQALEYLRQEIGELQQLSEELVNHLEGAEQTVEQPEIQEESIKEARELRDRLGKFKVDKDQGLDG
ncbi:MAG: methyl-accepting chemotaxis protein [Anaerolineales bacterium]|nr:methyl-accepting chemotaxis protein [Anaerolineales bacterium]